MQADTILHSVESLLKRPHPLLIVSFSIDGPPEMHDRVRGLPGGYAQGWSTYERVRSIAERADNLTTVIETTVSAYNLPSLLPWLEEKMDEGHRFTITVAHHADLYKNKQGKKYAPPVDPNLDQIIRLFERRRVRHDPRDWLNALYLGNVLAYLRHPERMPVPCKALESSVSLDPYGEVIPCLMWHKSLGNVRHFDYRIDRVLQTPGARQTRKEIVKEQCPNCWTPCEAYQAILGRLFTGRRVSPVT
jgi:MoaA/NifB/PqqE/SkfB family radical SAM enzyme